MDLNNIDLHFDENPIPMWIYNPADLSIKAANASARKLYGYSAKEVNHMKIFDLHPKGEIPSVKRYFDERHRDFHNAGIWKHKKKDGDIIFVRILSYPVFVKDEKYKLATIYNVTGQIEYQEKYELLFKNSLDGFIIARPSGEIIEANEAACQILGMPEEEIISKGREGLVLPDEQLKKALSRRSETGSYSGELTFIHNTGSRIPVEVESSIFTNYAGDKLTSIVFRDISDRKEVEEELKIEQEFSDVILNSLPGIFFILNTEGRVINWNDRVEEIFEMSAGKIRNRPVVDFVYPEDQELVLQKIQKVLEGVNTTVELKLKTPGDRDLIYKFISSRFDRNGRTYIVGTGIDITSQKKLENEIRSLLQSEHAQRKQAELDRDKLRAMFENTPSPKYMVEGDEFRYVIANAAYRELIGQDDIIGKKLIDVVPEVEEQGYYDILKQVYRSGERYMGIEKPLSVVHDTGEEDYTVANLTYEPMFDENGDVYGVFAEAIDVKEQLKYRNQLQESLREKEVLLSEIHHRVKNNLAIVSGIMQLQIFDSENGKVIQQLIDSQNRIKSIALIHELLYQSESFSSVKLGEKIKDLVHQVSDSLSQSVEIKVKYDLDTIALNVNQAVPLTLIINELITNVYKHAFKEPKNGMMKITLHQEDEYIFLNIKDNGDGLPENLDVHNPETVGLKIINVLTKQLNGSFTFTNKETGAEATLKFKKERKKGSSGNIELKRIDS